MQVTTRPLNAAEYQTMWRTYLALSYPGPSISNLSLLMWGCVAGSLLLLVYQCWHIQQTEQVAYWEQLLAIVMAIMFGMFVAMLLLSKKQNTGSQKVWRESDIAMVRRFEEDGIYSQAEDGTSSSFTAWQTVAHLAITPEMYLLVVRHHQVIAVFRHRLDDAAAFEALLGAHVEPGRVQNFA